MNNRNLLQTLPAQSALWAGTHAPEWVDQLPFRRLETLDDLGAAPGLLVVGGGSRIDEAKALRIQKPELKLVVVPTLWGSGAEASPVVVLNRDGGKEIHVDDVFLPDAVFYDAAVLSSITSQQILNACADTWAHALEGCFSPLASDEVQVELAALIGELLSAPVAADMRWFDWSARACAGQARSGVGLAHGLAHALEPLLKNASWGHARLIRAVLLPVIRFNRSQGDKWACTAEKLGIELDAVEAALSALWDSADFDALCPHMSAHWKTIARDPCSRVNSVLVRGSSLSTLLQS